MSTESSKDSFPRLPDRFGPEIASFPECSYSAVRVTLVLKDGRRVHDVIIDGADVICKIGQTLISSKSDLPFMVSEVQSIERG